MSCCSIASGCGIPVTGCTGTSVAAGHVLVDLSAGQMPLYVDTCKGDIYYWDGTKWIMLGKDDKFLLYDAASRVLTLQPDGSSVQLPLASTVVAGLVKIGATSAIGITTDGVLVVNCAVLKTQCDLLDKTTTPTGNVIYYNTTTNTLDVDCAKLKQQCGLLDKNNVPVGNVIYYNTATDKLDINCGVLKTECALAGTADLPVSGPVVKINPTSKQLEVDCGALKAQCNLATMADIPTIPATPVYDFGQQASLNGTTLHIANTQNPAAGVDVDLSSLVGSSGGGGGLAYVGVSSYSHSAGNGNSGGFALLANRATNTIDVPFYVISTDPITTFLYTEGSLDGSTWSNIVPGIATSIRYEYTGMLHITAGTLVQLGKGSGYTSANWWVANAAGLIPSQGATS